MKKLGKWLSLLTACMAVLGMTAGMCQAASYDATGAAGQTIQAEGEGVFLFPGDSVLNTEIYIGEEQEPVGLDSLEDGSYGWKNRSGKVYRLFAHTDVQEVFEEEPSQPVPVYDEFGNPVYDEETGEQVFDWPDPEMQQEPSQEAYTWYDMQAWGAAVEAVNGSFDAASEAPYSPEDAVYYYTDAEGNSAQVSSQEITAAAYPLYKEVNLTADSAPEGKAFSGWAVYKVDGDSLTAVTQDMLVSDQTLIPGLSPDQLGMNPLHLSINGFSSRIVFMPVYASAQPEGMEPGTQTQELDPVTGEPLNQEAGIQTQEFDPVTGEPLNQEAGIQTQEFDPVTGEPLNQEAGIQTQEFDPVTGEPLNQGAGEFPGEEISILSNVQPEAINIQNTDEFGTGQTPEEPQPEPQAQNSEEPQPVYMLTLADASSDPADLSAVAEGTEIRVTAADKEAEGLVFDRWIPTNIELDEDQLTQPELSFLMPASDAALAVQYKEKEPAQEPAAEPAQEPAVEPAQEPAVEPAAEPAAEPAPEPAAEPAQEPVVEAAAEPAQEPAAEPAPEPAQEPVVEAAAEPAAEPAQEPAVEPAAEPAQEPVVEAAAVPDHTLTVNSGSGSGSFAKDTPVQITADAPAAGYRFKEWTVSGSGTIANAGEAQTTFTMGDSDAAVTANYEQITYTLTVNSGSGSGSFAKDTPVQITANVAAAGYRFKEWTVSGGGTIANANEAQTTFTMGDSDATVTANYEQITYTLTVNSGSGSGTHYSGEPVVITADDPASGYRFSSWSLTSGNGTIASTTQAQTTFTMTTSDAVVTANYELIPYTLTVKKGSGSGTFTKGTSVDITPNFPASGKEFDRWEKTSGSISFDSTKEYYATVTMKASDATVTALYKDGPNPNNNTIKGLEHGAEYLKSTTLTFTAGGAGMDNTDPNPGDYRYRPSGYQIGSVGGSWSASPYTTSMAINAVGEYTLTVTYAKDVYDGSKWNADGTSVTKSITFHVVNALSVQTGDSSPLILLAVVGGAALAVIVVIVLVLVKRRRRKF